MPPKKSSEKDKERSAKFSSEQACQPTEPQDRSAKDKPSDNEKTAAASNGDHSENVKKRKAPSTTTSSEQPGAKAPRRQGRSAAKLAVPPKKLIPYLLSDSAVSIARPKNEHEDSLSIRSYSTTVPLTPFEELFSAVILSRPISHALGQRSIRTLLNEPYNFRTPKKILDAGEETVHKSLWDARTQHKAKTAEQIIGLAKTVKEKYGTSDEDTSLGKLKAVAKEKGAQGLEDELSGSIKGVGKTGVSIFLRRVQACDGFEHVYPYIDERTKASLEKLGLPGDAEALRKTIEEAWSDAKSSVKGKANDAVGKRLVFVRVMERAIGADLEGRIDDLLTEAEKK